MPDGELTSKFFTTEDARRLAKRRIPKQIFDFVDGATGREIANKRNQRAFDSIQLQARALVNVENRVLSKDFLGVNMGLPFGIAPMGMCNLVWPQTDEIFSRKSVQHKIPVGLSCAGSTTLEEMFAMSEGRAWMQLFVSGTMDWFWEIVARAEYTGYEVLVFTVDVPQVARRVRDLKNGFEVPFKMGLKQFMDFALHPNWSLRSLYYGVPRPMNFTESETGNNFDRYGSRGTADWELLDRLREKWPRKLIVKGVQYPEDATRIKAAGADAVYVSNHGGRQLDAAEPAICALAKIRESVGQSYPLIMDSGIRSGEDIVKALVTGADFVMLGRAMLYAAGADGDRGVSNLIQILRDEISNVMAQMGINNIADLTRENLVMK